MKKVTVKGLFVLVVSAFIIYSCQGGSNSQKAQEQISQKEADEVKVLENNDVSFVVADKYFVNNTVKEISNPKITTLDEFNKVFGAAATMGADGKPTEIDFSKQYVVAVVKSETGYSTTIAPVSLQKNDNQLVFTYKVETGEKQSYTIRPCLIIIVDKSNDGDVVLNEVE